MNHNRLLTTPNYINHGFSPYWSFVAHEKSIEIGETCCKRSKYQDKTVKCFYYKKNIVASVSCRKCEFVFIETSRLMSNQLLVNGF